jgi:hypothetical protein
MHEQKEVTNQHLNWVNTNPETVKLILNRADEYLSAQLSTAFAADQRATTLASVLVALATAVFGAATTEIADTAMRAGAIISGLVFLGAAWVASSAARPTEFYFNGAHPREWWPVRRHNIEELLGIETENLQEAIDHNSVVLTKNAEKIIAASRLAVAAPAIGLITWTIPFYLADFYPGPETGS